MSIDLNALHYVFMIFTLLILIVMVKKRDTTLICILGIFLLGIISTSSLYQGVMTVLFKL